MPPKDYVEKPPLADLGQEIRDSSYYKRWVEQYKGKQLKPKYEFPRVVTGRDYTPQTRPMKQGETAQQMPS